MSGKSSLESSDIVGHLDPYIEHLRKKYLERNDDTDVKVLETTDQNTTDNEPFSHLPPNPSLTESERKHYNRAMRELGKALKLSENNLRSSIAEFEKSIVPTDEDKRTSTGSGDRQCAATITDETTNQDTAADSESDALTWPTTLPSTIPIASKKIPSSPSECWETVIPSSWNDQTTLSGLSRQFNSCAEPDKISAVDVKAIYSELMGIYQKLLTEKSRIAEQQMIENRLEQNFESQEKELAIREAFLLEKEKELLERERSLSLGLQNMKRTKEIAAKLEGVELEVQERIDLLQQGHQLEVERLNAALLEKSCEVKRVRTSFNMMKDQNDEFRNKLSALGFENQKLKNLNSKLTKRLENLQRRQDFRACKPTHIVSGNAKFEKENVAKQFPSTMKRISEKASPKQFVGMLEALSVTFDWLSEVHLKRCDTNDMAISISVEYAVDKCLKILPLLVDVVKILPSYSTQKKHHLSILSFVYLCLCRIDESQNALLSSTTRRLGDELYKPSHGVLNSRKASSASLILATTASSTAVDSIQSLSFGEKTQEFASDNSVYFRSNVPEIRLLSCFIVLKTLHQVDVLAHVFGQMKKDLKNENNRKIFLDYNATHIVLPYVTYRANKALIGDAIDVILQMSMESALLPAFLEQCSTEQWFRTFSSTLRSAIGSLDKSSSPNTVIIEKLSIILQKLSKVKTNRKYFDAFSMGRHLQECYRTCDPKNTFLVLNLRSILFNLNLLKDNS
uniref:coiled-coil domain-containing protein 138-like n=1 Tax=Styela clava TaxID=7725 RepID=UPI00193A78F3|nr:coiled-coil domain-containing protein 138-like [Styela clava]